MPVKVIDASAACAIAFGEPEGALIASRIEGHDLIAPTLLEFEVANTCLKKIRLGLEDRSVLIDG
jgi:predicted nucleic acid-binding protein